MEARPDLLMEARPDLLVEARPDRLVEARPDSWRSHYVVTLSVYPRICLLVCTSVTKVVNATFGKY